MSKQHPRGRGRPRKTLEEREAAKERRIPVSKKGRLKFRPGDKHALDIQFKEARNYRLLLAAQLEKLQSTQAALDALDDPGVMISREERELKRFFYEEYHDHKHIDHIAATWLAIRRQRLLARLQAADDALTMAQELLTPEPDLLDDLKAAVAHLRAAVELRQQQPRTQPPDVAGPEIGSRHMFGNVKDTRAQLALFESQVNTMRAALNPASVWFEEYYVKKVKMNPEARACLTRHEPIPAGMEVWIDLWYGPYLKCRFEEVPGGPAYTLQMSLVPEDELPSERIDDEEERDNPWPTL